jgi:hypothetical protein
VDAGFLSLTSASILNNHAGCGKVAGGGLYVSTGYATLSHNDFSGNHAQAAEVAIPCSGEFAQGGGLYIGSARLSSSNDTFISNTVLGGNNMSGFVDGQGGGLYNNGGTVILTNDTLAYNQARTARMVFWCSALVVRSVIQQLPKKRRRPTSQPRTPGRKSSNGVQSPRLFRKLKSRCRLRMQLAAGFELSRAGRARGIPSPPAPAT